MISCIMHFNPMSPLMMQADWNVHPLYTVPHRYSILKLDSIKNILLMTFKEKIEREEVDSIKLAIKDACKWQ